RAFTRAPMTAGSRGSAADDAVVAAIRAYVITDARVGSGRGVPPAACSGLRGFAAGLFAQPRELLVAEAPLLGGEQSPRPLQIRGGNHHGAGAGRPPFDAPYRALGDRVDPLREQALADDLGLGLAADGRHRPELLGPLDRLPQG